ncbi:hypothetical protein WOLCODRAFT_158984 [Wolfiporia cocos MD-104 SS10]|uniref:Uncharacterized protein n=1 Tax=Wolfiporia cocos (strain MD-104) TaxID=742152 RepID=A0A2H3JCW8_WOLCO|nr:hypothetical protein WOLCODRAFT_158984 [Wolfiporia cocos MD-104 SS10]
MTAARPMERRLPKPSIYGAPPAKVVRPMVRRHLKTCTTATAPRPPPASPHRQRQPLSIPLTLLEPGAHGPRPLRRTLTGRHLRRVAISAARPLERRLPKPTPTPPLQRTRLARMERRLPKPSTYDAPSQDVNAGALPDKVACPRSGASLKRPPRPRHPPALSQALGAAFTAYSQLEQHLPKPSSRRTNMDANHDATAALTGALIATHAHASAA